MNKYTAQIRRYFSNTEAYTADVIIEEDGSLDEWIEVEELILHKNPNLTPLQNLIELRDLLNDVITDLQGVDQ